MKKSFDICILARIEHTEDPNEPIVEICEKVTVDGKEIEIPEGCVAKVSYASYEKE
jgi:hypothetical protein